MVDANEFKISPPFLDFRCVSKNSSGGGFEGLGVSKTAVAKILIDCCYFRRNILYRAV